MALNLETALRVVAKVQGLNEFKALTEGLNATGAASQNSKTSLQQLSTESARLTQETTRASGGVRAQTAAVQGLTAAQRQAGQEAVKVTAAAKGQQAAMQALAADTEKLTQGSVKAAGGIKGQAQALQGLTDAGRTGAESLRSVQQGASGLSTAVSEMRSNASGALDGLTGSAAKSAAGLKELQRSVQPTEAVLAQLRNEVLQVGAASKQTERSLAQQVDALKTLRSQSEINGQVYNSLTSDIERLTAVSKGSTGATREMAASQDNASQSMNRGSKAVQAQVRELQKLQSNLQKGSKEYQDIGRQIDELKRKAAGLDLSKGLNIAGAIGGSAVSGAVGQISNAVRFRQQLAQSLPGRVVLTGEGLTAAGITGAAGASVATGLGGAAANINAVASSFDSLATKAMSFSGMFKPVGELLGQSFADAASGIAQWGNSLAAAQAKLAALSAPLEGINTAIHSIGPEAAAAAGVASLAIAAIYPTLKREIDKALAEAKTAFKGMSNETQAMLDNMVRSPALRIAEFERIRSTNLGKIQNLSLNSAEARRAANSVASAEREIAKITSEQNQILDVARQRQNASTDALKQQIEVAKQRLEIQKRITAGIKAEREEYAAERVVAGSIRRNQERLARDEARAERLRQRAAAAFAPSTVLALPAAGQTSFRGAVTAEGLGGGARMPGTFEIAGTRQQIGAPMAGYGEAARAGLAQQEQAANRTTGALAKLFMELSRVQEASNGSIGALQRQRQAWDAIRLAVNPAAPAYENAKAAIAALDDEINKLTQKPKEAGNAIASLWSQIEKLSAETNGSISSLQQQRQAWQELRNIVDPASATFAKANAQINRLDGELKGLTTTAEKPRRVLAGIFAEIEKVTAGSNGSIGSLQRQKAAWEALRVAVNPAAPAYQRATEEVKRLEGELQRLNGTQEKVAKRGLGREALGGAAGALATGGGLQSAIGAAAGTLAFTGGPAGIAAGAALTVAAGAGSLAARVGVDAETAQVRLKALTDQFGEYNQAQESASRIAQTLRISQTEAEDSFSKLYAALRPTGITIKEVEDSYIGFTAAARASGATAEESAAAFMQLKQALGSGVLQGDELRSIKEQAPAVGQAIAKEMGVAVGELKDLGAQGKITTDIVLRALAKLKNEKLDDLNAQFNTSAQAIKDLQIATEDFGRAIARAFGPTAVGVLKTFTKALRDAQQNPFFGTPNPVMTQRQQTASDINQRARAQAEAQVNRLLPWWDMQGRERTFQKLTQQYIAQLLLEDRRQYSQSGQTTTAAQRSAVEQAAAERRAAAARAIARSADEKAKGDDKAKTKADKAATDAQRNAETFAQNQIRLDDMVFAHRQELARSAYDLQKELIDLETQNRIDGLKTVEQRQAAQAVEESRQREQQLLERRRALESEVAKALQDVASAKRMAAVTGGGLAATTSGVIARTGGSGQVTGPHLDARWADGRRITAADVDRYISVNGRAPSSYGVTSPHGPRNLFGRTFHAGADFGTPSGAPITLKSGASVLRDLGFTGAGGYAVEIDTPEGRMRLLHLQGGTAAPRQQRTIADVGDVAQARERLRLALAKLAQFAAVEPDLREAGKVAEVNALTAAFSSRNTELEKTLRVETLRAELEARGYGQDRLQLELDLNDAYVKRKDTLDQIPIENTTAIDAVNKAYQEQVNLLKQIYALKQADASSFGFREGAKRYVESIGTMKEATSNLTQQGLKGLEDTLVSLSTTGTANFQAFAASILEQTARMIIQQLVLKTIMQAIGAIGGGGGGGGFSAATDFAVGSALPNFAGFAGYAKGDVFASSGIVPYANGGIVTRPTLFEFADGGAMRTGLMGEAGPEAIIPLSRGANGKLGIAGGGSTTNVVVNVDASGGTSASGDQEIAGQLGKAIAIVVQQELVKQRRRGGILNP